MGLQNWIIGRKVNGVYKKMSNDKKSTVLGVGLGAVIAANIDYAKALNGDTTEISKGLVALIVAVIGYFTNKPENSGPEILPPPNKKE